MPVSTRRMTPPDQLQVVGESALAGPAEVVREPSNADLRELLDRLSAVLRRMVDQSWRTHLECARYGSLPSDIAMAPLALHRHCIEAAEGIAALCAALGSTPASIVLRSQYEAWLGLQYLLEHEGKVKERSLAWIVGDKIEALKAVERMDKRSSTGKAYLAMLKQDRLVSGARRHPQPVVRRLASKLKAELSQPALDATVKSFRARRKHSGRSVEWYSLGGGPRNLAELARHLSVPATHLGLYGGWSSTAHARDSSQLLAPTHGGGRVLRPINDPTPLPGTVGLSVQLLLDCSTLLLKRLRAGNETNLARWYATEVMPTISKLQAIDIKTEVKAVY